MPTTSADPGLRQLEVEAVIELLKGAIERVKGPTVVEGLMACLVGKCRAHIPDYNPR